MHLKIESKQKMEIFSSIFQLFKSWGTHINMQFSEKGLYIQLMDKSHICLSELNLNNDWFTEYTVEDPCTLCINCHHFATMMSYALKHNSLEMNYYVNETNTKYSSDHLYINFINLKENKNVFDHFFEIPLIESDNDIMGIPSVNYSVELTIEAKKIIDVLNELIVFGQDLNVICDEDKLQFGANGDGGNLKVHIMAEDLDEYAIDEDEIINISYSLSHLCKMCLSVKLSQNIYIGISEDYPMILKYDLGSNSDVKFYVAPKVID